MKTIVAELQTDKFESEAQKSHLNILLTASWLKVRFMQRIKKAGISLEQYNVLRILRGVSPNFLCVKEITERMIDKNSNTTRILEKLLAKNMVVKAQSMVDKREWNVSITKQGLAILVQLDNDFVQNPLHISSLSEQESALLNDLLDKLRDCAGCSDL